MKTNLLPSRDRPSSDGARGSAARHRESPRCRLSTVSAMVLLAAAVLTVIAVDPLFFAITGMTAD